VTEITDGGHKYRVGRLDARKQFHIVRRLAPVLGELQAVASVKKPEDAFAPLAVAVSRLSDEDSDYCIFGLLAVVSREQEQGLGWGPVSTGTTLMYDDVDLGAMLRLAWFAFSENLSGFFPAAPSGSKGRNPKGRAGSNG
jgi:hypothetical protein